MNFTIDSIIRDDIKICQPKKPAFRFGCDSVILAYFSHMKSKWNIADAGSGSGVIAALCAKIYGVSAVALELQDNMFQALLETIDICELENKIAPIKANIADFRTSKKFDAVICNPPYRKEKTGRVNPSTEGRIARFSSEMSMETLTGFCRKNLTHGGKLFFSYDADMLSDAMEICRKSRMEPKRLKFLHPSISSKAKLVFIECVFGGGKEVIIEKPLFQKGSPEITEEYNNIFQGDKYWRLPKP